MKILISYLIDRVYPVEGVLIDAAGKHHKRFFRDWSSGEKWFNRVETQRQKGDFKWRIWISEVTNG